MKAIYIFYEFNQICIHHMHLFFTLWTLEWPEQFR